jgi:hypothetical protein
MGIELEILSGEFGAIEELSDDQLDDVVGGACFIEKSTLCYYIMCFFGFDTADCFD